MDPVAKAIWYIESHFADAITLDDIAEISGLSRFSLSRAFGTATDRSVMRYVRGRRLTEAAKSLANGAGDVLALALETGYGSHEAFSRAFRDQFGLTPESLRAQRSVDNIPLVEPLIMDKSLLVKLEPPRFEKGKLMLIAGLSERYSYETCASIPSQWQRFVPHLGNIPGQVGNVTYGVRSNSDDAGNFDYLTGVEVESFDGLPKELTRLRIPARRYAVFTHKDHISKVRSTHYTIWSQWLPNSGHEAADAPDFERYDERFNPRTGSGGMEIWVPISK
jgi:AraC family transcriptional regulator